MVISQGLIFENLCQILVIVFIVYLLDDEVIFWDFTFFIIISFLIICELRVIQLFFIVLLEHYFLRILIWTFIRLFLIPILLAIELFSVFNFPLFVIL